MEASADVVTGGGAHHVDRHQAGLAGPGAVDDAQAAPGKPGVDAEHTQVDLPDSERVFDVNAAVREAAARTPACRPASNAALIMVSAAPTPPDHDQCSVDLG
jgi:hypothetical protein